MKRILAVLILMVLYSGPAFAAGEPVPSNWQEATPESLAEAGFVLMMKGDFVKMANEWFSHFDLAMISKDKLELAKRQYIAQIPMAGKIKRYELISRKQYGQSIVKLKYLVVTDKMPLIFRFMYYKPDDEWVSLNINFNDKLEPLDD